ncbi:glycerophosphodiester phosphodiesterase [Salinactinospora qingdaonensis]|uniref:GP-PDE domain-containing protein n=1 Tax=Salinactinospora qingdaonensis TaxID=702744 RepID=A0ABP7G0P1_9ACTN
MIFTATEIIGHRGAGRDGAADRESAENTVASALAAVEAGATWVEIDVRRSADGVLMAHHEPVLADGQAIVDVSASTCRSFGLATLAEIFEAVPAHVGVDVDVKTVMEDAVAEPAQRTVALLAPLLRREVRRRSLLVCSFDPAVLPAIRKGVRGIATAWMPFVRNPPDQAVAGAAGMGCEAVAIDARSFGDPDKLQHSGYRDAKYTAELAHRAGMEVVLWCPTPQEAAMFAAAGVDAVVVDDIAGTREALRGL